MVEAPQGSNAPDAFPFVLLVYFAETCVLADPAAVDALDLHVFCSCSCARVHCNSFPFTRLKLILY